MGLTVREILKASTFSDYELLAGREGLDKQVQGVAIQDAPDALKWTKGREFVITSGYLFWQDKNLIYEYIENEGFKNISCLGVKTRYIKGFPTDVLEKLDELKIPLVVIPAGLSWMDVINNLNVLVMNKNIKQFNIGSINPRNISNLSYQGRKINKILSKMEVELNFPAMLYDMENERPYYSSNSFTEILEDSKVKNFWQPEFEYTKEILCDNINMIRYRFRDERYDRPYSWITIPIKVGNTIKAYFTLVEKTELIDYFDQFSIRIGFLLLQSLYEQMVAVREIEDSGFEKFSLDLISGYLNNHEDIVKRALELDIYESDKHLMLLMRQENKNISIYNKREEVRKAMSNSFDIEGFRSAIIDRNSLLVLIPVQNKNDEEFILNHIDDEIIKLRKRLEINIHGSSYIFSMSDIPEDIFEFKRNYFRCEQTLKMGKILYPNKTKTMYSQLGPFSWMDIEEQELKYFKGKFDSLLKKDGTDDLIQTLKMYLECNMNYSQTAKNMFIHINTVRKRIEETSHIMDIDLENPMDRLNLEILLKLLY